MPATAVRPGPVTVKLPGAVIVAPAMSFVKAAVMAVVLTATPIVVPPEGVVAGTVSVTWGRVVTMPLPPTPRIGSRPPHPAASTASRNPKGTASRLKPLEVLFI